MTRVWAATCKHCGNVGALRSSDTVVDVKIEIPNFPPTTKVVCSICQKVNEFSSADITEVDATILPRSGKPSSPGS